MILALLLTLSVAQADLPPPGTGTAPPQATGPDIPDATPAASTDGAPAGSPEAAPAAAPAEPSQPEYLIPGLPPGTPPSPAEAERLSREIGEGLRCPVCQGLSIADSSASAAVMMFKLTRELVAAGYTRTEIEDYFVSKYGEWVLLDPRQGGLNQLVWIGPALAFGLGLLAALAFLRRAGDDVTNGAAAPAADADDDFSRRILNEAEDD